MQTQDDETLLQCRMSTNKDCSVKGGTIRKQKGEH